MFNLMKTVLLIMTLVLVMCAGAMAYTGILPEDNTPFTVQNVKAISPQVTGASCVQITKTKGTLATFPTTDSLNKFYIMFGWTASDNSGNPLIVKRTLNGNSAYQSGSSGELTVNHGITAVTFSAYSSAAKSYNICVDRQ